MQISLKKKKLSSGKFSWYIEFYDGSYVDKNGTMKHNRSFEYLKLYTLQEPQTAIDKKKDKEKTIILNDKNVYQYTPKYIKKTQKLIYLFSKN